MQHDRIDILQADAVSLLKELIATPSFSKEEDITAGILCRFLGERGVVHHRIENNVYAYNLHYDKAKPSVLLNSHHDTVKPNKGYTLDPFSPIVKDGKLFGLGSNDAGGCLVSLIATFLFFYHREDLPFNVVLAASAEEEISGFNGIELLVKELGPIDFGIVGEPTQMQMAIAEKGLLVLDVHAEGRAGHAAREEGDNSIYKALTDIQWFSTYKYPKVSELLGPVKMSVTVIETENKAHNVVPSQTHFVVDVRVNELYTFEEVLDIIRMHTSCKVTPRSLRMRSSYISLEHPLIKAGLKLGRTYYGSPTTSDKALMPFTTLKMGPGDSARSHTADEYIHIDEINHGIELYIQFLKELI
ncbi:MAG: M20 family metallo-hydrolase [Flavitalea sp.]